MGQHKTNPTAIKAKQGLIPPKKKNEYISKEELLKMVSKVMVKQIFRGPK